MVKLGSPNIDNQRGFFLLKKIHLKDLGFFEGKTKKKLGFLKLLDFFDHFLPLKKLVGFSMIFCIFFVFFCIYVFFIY